MSGHVLAIALGNSLLWSIYLLLTRHVVSGAQLDAWAYTLVQLLSAGLVLLWVGRRTPGSWADLLLPWTVCYAFMRVIINGCTAAAIVWLAVTQSTLISTVSVLIGAGTGWALTRQAPARHDWPGLALLAVGIAAFVAALASETAWRGVAWLLASEAVAVAASWMIAYHPRNQANDPAARSRFTGEILVAASLALILVWTLAGLAGAMASPWAGGGDAFGRIELWLYAILAGPAVPCAGHLARLLDHQPFGRADLPDRPHRDALLRHRARGVLAHAGWLTPAASPCPNGWPPA